MKNCKPAVALVEDHVPLRNGLASLIKPTELNSVLDVALHKEQKGHHFQKLNERELEFLKLCCTEYTYKEIAERMFLSPRTIDGYRDSLFEKLRVKTRVGLVLYAIRNGIVSP